MFASASNDSQNLSGTAGGGHNDFSKKSGYLNSPLFEASTERPGVQYRKPRLNYELMTHKIQKMIQGEYNPPSQ